MNFKLAKRIMKVKPSPTLAVAAKAQQLKAMGKDIINLGTGEPDFDTPAFIKAAAMTAISEGFTKYTAADGIPTLKQAVCQKFKEENKLGYELNEVIVTVGAKQGLYNLCMAILEAGDEAIIPAPYWVSYPDMVLLAEAKPVIIKTSPETRYKITPEALEAAITAKTKLLFLNSPSNPSGVAYSLEELKAFADILLRHPQVLIASDDIYEHILWRKPFVNILNACPDLLYRTVIFNGVSKAYAMTGWRIGYAAGPAPIIQAMKTLASQSTSNPCSIAQKAAIAALTGSHNHRDEMVQAFKERHEFLVGCLLEIQDITVVPADGTFYLFPSIQNIIEKKGLSDDITFANKLLDETGLALVPGSAFGQPGAIRFSFATSMSELEKAMERFTNFCQK